MAVEYPIDAPGTTAAAPAAGQPVALGWDGQTTYNIYSWEEANQRGAAGATVTDLAGTPLWEFGQNVGAGQVVGAATGGGSLGGGGGQQSGPAPGQEYVDPLFSSWNTLPPGYFVTQTFDAQGKPDRTSGRLVSQGQDGQFYPSPQFDPNAAATDAAPDDTSGSGSGWVDYGSGRRGGYPSGGGGYGSSGGSYGPDHVGAMQSAELHAGRMGTALRASMGAPIPQMPGQSGEDDGYRRPAYVPGGASVDSYGNPQTAPTPSGEGRTPPWPGAYQSWMGGSGSSSGDAPSVSSAMASARARIQGALGGMSGGGDYSGYPSSSAPPPPPPGHGRGKPPTEPITGWAKRQGYTAPMIQDIGYYRPEAFIPDAVGFDVGEPGFNTLREMAPDVNAAMMLGPGATKKNFTPGPSQYANFANAYYDDVVAGRQLDAGEMLGNLLSPKQGSALDMQMEAGTPESNAYTLESYFNTVAGAMPPPVQAAMTGYFRNATTDYLSDSLSRKNPKPIGRYIDRRYL